MQTVKKCALQTFYRGADLVAAQLHCLPVRVFRLAQSLRLFDIVAVALVDDGDDGRACAPEMNAPSAPSSLASRTMSSPFSMRLKR